MQLPVSRKALLLSVAAAALVITAFAFQSGKKISPADNLNNKDTVPATKKKSRDAFSHRERFSDFDEELRELEKAKWELDANLDKIDWDKINDEIDKSMKEAQKELENTHLELGDVQKEIHDALKNIDFDEIGEETGKAVQQSIKNIDFDDIGRQVQKALHEVKVNLNSPEFDRTLKEAARVDMSEVKKSLEQARVELEKNKLNLQEQLEKARTEIDKASEEFRAYDEMLDRMDEEGLIDRNKDFIIEFDGGELYIDHHKQPAELRDKYRKYFRKDGTEIRRKNGRFDINID